MTAMSINLTSGSLGPTVLATTWAECGVGTIVLCLRIYVNAFITRRWKWDFWWALMTYVEAVIATVTLTVSVVYGLGDHLADILAVNPSLIITNQFYQWIFTTFAIVAIATGKLAIIAFILQIEGSTTGKRKWILYIFALSNVLVNITILPIVWSQCSPTAKMWDNSLPGNCDGRLRNQLYGYFQGSFGSVLDLALALYPVIIFWNLQLQMHVKIGLMVLCGFGVVAAACAAVKTKELSTITATSDITFDLATLNIWASTEMWIVFIVSCIPAIRPIFVKVIAKVYTTASLSRTYPSRSQYGQQNSSVTPASKSRAYASKMDASSKLSSLPTKNNESEENILPGDQPGGILMTNQVVVRYESGDGGNGRNMDWNNHFDGSVV